MIPSQAVALTSRVVNFGEAVMLHRRTPTCAGALSGAWPVCDLDPEKVLPYRGRIS
jgi:hypothetical protein